MRARRSSRSASGISIVNGRMAVLSASLSTVTAMWVLLGRTVVDDVTDPDRLVCTSRPSRTLGLLTGLRTGPLAGRRERGEHAVWQHRPRARWRRANAHR